MTTGRVAAVRAHLVVTAALMTRPAIMLKDACLVLLGTVHSLLRLRSRPPRVESRGRGDVEGGRTCVRSSMISLF